MGRALKILAIADLHGRIDRLLSLETGDADLIVVCGDLHNGGSEEEVLREATIHLAEVHHITEVTPGIAATVQRNIRTE